MTALPTVTGRDEFDALVVRTDYQDDQAWQDVVAVLRKPWGDGQYEAHVHVIDDPVWAGATPDEVVTAVRADEDLSVVFLADRMTMQADGHALPHTLLAVTTLTREECVDDEDYEQLTEFGLSSAPPPQGSTTSTRTSASATWASRSTPDGPTMIPRASIVPPEQLNSLLIRVRA
ncbi:hypothetical protein OIB37_34940 [Streptomyces sp. NBC_00820]|nr:hypothetical protein OIB37_34940 [Streptomyces sp. NBC_00820]